MNQITIPRDKDFFWFDLKKDPNEVLLRTQLFLEIENYFVGSFSINGDEEFEYINNKFFKYLFQYNELFISRLGGQFQLWRVGDKWNKGIYVDTVQCSLIQENIPQDKQMLVKMKNGVQGIYVRWDNSNLTMLQSFGRYVDEQIKFIKAWKTAVMMDNKRFIYLVNNDNQEIAKQEIESMLNPETPFVYNINPMATQSIDKLNLFQEIKMGESNSQTMYVNIQNLRNLYKDIFGMVGNNYFKKANLTENETLIDNYNQENFSGIIERNLTNFIRDAKKLWGIDLRLNRANELQQKDQGEQDEQTEQNKPSEE